MALILHTLLLTTGLLLVTMSEALFCYSCFDLTKQNYKCNEREPMKCSPKQQKCGIADENTRLIKGCIEGCPGASRGDNAEDNRCFGCSGDFCNRKIPRMASIKQDIANIYLDYPPFHFTIIWEAMTYWEARVRCIARNQTLASIHSENLQNFLQTSLDNNKPSFKESDATNGLWIGARSVQDNVWMWTDDGSSIPRKDNTSCPIGLKKYQAWGPTQPEVVPPKRNFCGVFQLSPQTGWSGQSCGKLAVGFICQSTSTKTDGPTHGLIQSVVVNNMLYTYHSMLTDEIQSDLQCSSEGGQLANLQVQNLCSSVKLNLEYVLDSKKFRSNGGCRKEPIPSSFRSHVSNSSREELLPFICEKVFEISDCKDPTQSLISQTTTQATTSILTTPSTQSTSSSVTSSFVTSQVDKSTSSVNVADDVITHTKCLMKNITYDKVTFSFPSTSYRTYSPSLQRCSSGRPLASVFCDQINGMVIFDMKTFATNICNLTIYQLLTESTVMRKNLKPLSSQLRPLTANLRLLTSQPSVLTYDDVINSIEILKNIDNMTQPKVDDLQDQVEVSPETLTDILTTLSSIQSTVMTSKSEQKFNEHELTFLAEMFLIRVGLNRSKPVYELTTNHMTVKAMELSSSSKSITFSSPKDNDGNISNNFITIEASTLQDIFNQTFDKQNSLRAVFISHDSDVMFPSKQHVISKVFTATVANSKEERISLPVSFSLQQYDIRMLDECSAEHCSFYVPERQAWSTEGCTLIEMDSYYDNSTFYCSCNHTTSFAVVISYQEEGQHLALDITSEIGLIVCVFCLLATVVLFLTIPELRRIRSSDIHINLFVCLAVAYIVFLCGVEQTGIRPLCVAIAAVIHFFLLSAWGWMAVESITMFRMFVVSFDHSKIKGNHWMAAGVYFTSTIIVLFTIGGVLIEWNMNGSKETNDGCSVNDKWSNYVGDGYCWLRGFPLYFGFIAVVGVMLLINVIMAFLVIRAITWGRRKVESSIEESPSMQVLRGILVALLMGVSWVFAIPVVVTQNETVQLVFAWIFALSISFQGLFIFYFFCLRRSDIRNAWMKPICNLFRYNKGHYDVTTTRGEGSFQNNEKKTSKPTMTSSVSTETSGRI